jgi:hypothetical protein
MRQQPGSYFTASSLPIPGMRSFIYMRKIAEICSRCASVYIEPVFRYRTVC